MSLPSAKPVATSPKVAAQVAQVAQVAPAAPAAQVAPAAPAAQVAQVAPQAAAEVKVMRQIVVRAAQFPMRVNHLNVTLLPGRPTPVVLDDWIQTQIDAGTLVVDQ